MGFHCTFNTVSCSDFERGCWNHSVQTQTLQQHQQVRCGGREGKCGGSKKGSEGGEWRGKSRIDGSTPVCSFVRTVMLVKVDCCFV